MGVTADGPVTLTRAGENHTGDSCTIPSGVLITTHSSEEPLDVHVRQEADIRRRGDFVGCFFSGEVTAGGVEFAC